MDAVFKSLLCCVFCFLLAAPVPVQAAGKEKQPVKEKLKADIRLEISWDIDNPNQHNTGHFRARVQGLLKLNKNFSSEGFMGKPVFVAYQNQGLHAHYDFFSHEIDKKPPEECKGPKAAVISEFQGQSTVPIPAIPGGAFELGVNYMKSQFDASGLGDMVSAFNPETKKLTDYYQFGMAAKKVKLSGSRRAYPDPCDHKKDEMEISVVQVGIVSAMAADGIMSGSKSWSTRIDSGTPSLTVRVREMPEELQGSRLSPEPQPGGNVRYTLSWRFEDPKPVVIQRCVNNKWRDVDSDASLTEVVVGEKVELRGIVLPKTKDTKKGTWKIDDNPAEAQRNFIEDYVADDKSGQVVHIRKFDRPVMRFHWFRGQNGVVTYTTEVDGVSQTQYAEFTLKRPTYTVQWEASGDSVFGDVTQGLNQDLLDRFPPGNRTHTGSYNTHYEGLHYRGILFQCENTSDLEGDTQWVQLLKSTQGGIGRNEQGSIADLQPVTVQGLDTVYPCARNESFFDAPALITNTLAEGLLLRKVDMDFDLYVMFRPKGKEGEPDKINRFVPIKKIKWGWAGIVVQESSTGRWRKDDSLEPIQGPDEKGDPREEDTQEYPTWSVNTATVK